MSRRSMQTSKTTLSSESDAEYSTAHYVPVEEPLHSLFHMTSASGDMMT